MRVEEGTGQPVAEARKTLQAFVQDGMTLDALIAWAEGLTSQAPVEDSWLRHVAAELANPLLCREQALALALDFLRARPKREG
ncbi:MAG: hypothetical protein ACLPJH_03910 [Myxococcaceae bacterium]